MKIYINTYGAYTDELMAEVIADDGNYLKANIAHVGRRVYVLVKTIGWCGHCFRINEVLKVFSNLRSAVRSNEWKSVVATATDVYEPNDDDVMWACSCDDIYYSIIALDVSKEPYFRHKHGRHTRLVTSGVVYSRKIDYNNDGGRHIAVAFRPGTRMKNICRIFWYDVIESRDCYKVYDGNTMLFALPPDTSFMGLISKVAAIDDYVVNGWWE